MTDFDRRALTRAYKETPRPAGVFRIRNTATGRSLVAATPNLTGTLNRQRFQLAHGSHPERDLQKEWNEFGPDAFEFDVLDRLEPRDEPGYDSTLDLRVLEDMWVEKLTASGEPLYGRPPYPG